MGRQLEFDPETQRFVGDEQANQMVTRKFRAPYVVPEKVPEEDRSLTVAVRYRRRAGFR